MLFLWLWGLHAINCTNRHTNNLHHFGQSFFPGICGVALIPTYDNRQVHFSSFMWLLLDPRLAQTWCSLLISTLSWSQLVGFCLKFLSLPKRLSMSMEANYAEQWHVRVFLFCLHSVVPWQNWFHKQEPNQFPVRQRWPFAQPKILIHHLLPPHPPVHLLLPSLSFSVHSMYRTTIYHAIPTLVFLFFSTYVCSACSFCCLLFFCLFPLSFSEFSMSVADLCSACCHFTPLFTVQYLRSHASHLWFKPASLFNTVFLQLLFRESALAITVLCTGLLIAIWQHLLCQSKTHSKTAIVVFPTQSNYSRKLLLMCFTINSF